VDKLVEIMELMMDERKPEHIICAVRGGPESRATVTYAIDLALEHHARLTFLHILDVEFLDYATIGPVGVIYKELVEMGTFAMLILCDRAQRRGVTQVDYLVREGNIRKQLYQFAIETHAKVMVMGKPIRSPGTNVFKLNDFETFVSELEVEGNLQIVQVGPSPG
jgi:nucleotide-binding universal stress UspA family protein